MRKAAGLILAAMALTVGLWGANPQPKPRCMYFAFSFPPVALPASTLLLPAPAASKPILSCTGSPGRQSDPLIVPLRI